MKRQTENASNNHTCKHLKGHSGPVTGVLLALPKLAFSAAGCTVRLWDVEAQTCLKLLQHEPDCPVTSMSWISTFQGIVTVDGAGKLRTFSLDDIEATNREIVAPTQRGLTVEQNIYPKAALFVIVTGGVVTF